MPYVLFLHSGTDCNWSLHTHVVSYYVCKMKNHIVLTMASFTTSHKTALTFEELSLSVIVKVYRNTKISVNKNCFYLRQKKIESTRN